MSFINPEIHQDIVDAASTLKETYRFLNYSVDLQTEMEKCEIITFQNEWRIPLTILKRLDSMDRDWSITPKPLLHHMPDILLEPILFIEDPQITSWNWQNLSAFPIIATHPMTTKDDYADRSSKVQCEKRVLDKLAQWEQLTTTETAKTNNSIIMDHSSLVNTRLELRHHWHFVPKRDLNDFKRMQPCFKEGPKSRVCELDNLRFRF